MGTVAGYPYFEVEYTKDGHVFNQTEVTELQSFLEQDGTTDLFVVSHGWNNDMADARDLYRRLFECVRRVMDSNAVPGIGSRKYAIMAVLWPSKKFADKDLIASGAASAGSVIGNAELIEQIDLLKALAQDPAADEALESAKKLVPVLEDKKSAREEFVKLLRSVLPQQEKHDEDASTDFFSLPPDAVLDRLSKPVMAGAPSGHGAGGGTATSITGMPSPGGSAAGLRDFFSGIKSGARNLLNLVTYYQMKERAGLVGREGVGPVVRDLRTQHPNLRIHLIGHSFGGRLVTATAVGKPGEAPLGASTMTLLQAAFSHYGFAQGYEGNKDGLFRGMVTSHGVSGPVIITCTQNDQAVGLAYPLASLIAGQVASALGDRNDKYGGIGRNGAQKTPEASDGQLLPVGGAYQLQPGRLHNLNADSIIKGHSDICHDEVAYALLRSIALT